MKRVNVVVIGFGHLGKWHVQKALQLKNANLIGIVEPSEKGALSAKENHPNIPLFSKIEDVIDKIDAAIIVTPTSYHFEIAKTLVLADKHVFCEKPMTETLKQAEELSGHLEKKKNLVFQVGHSERFHKVWEYREKYSSFFEGLATVRMNRLAPFKGRATDVDVVGDLMIHDLDLLLYLFKETPCAVRSTGYKIRTDKWDYVSSDFSFRSGRTANITVGRNHVKEMRDIEISNSGGCLFFDLLQNKLQYACGSFEGDFVEEINYEKRDHLLIEQEYFFDSIVNQKKAIIDFHAGLSAVNLIDKVLESLNSKEQVFI